MIRYFVKTAGARFTVIDDATGYTVSAFWSLAEAQADANARNDR